MNSGDHYLTFSPPDPIHDGSPPQTVKRKKDKKKKKKDQSSDSEGEYLEYVTSTGEVYTIIPSMGNKKDKYDVRLHMTNERTFFKYLFSSFHLGAMGTFLLVYYSQPSIYKPLLIILIWLLAFSFIAWGLSTYYQRRNFLKQGKLKDIKGLQMHGPTYVLLCFLVVFIFILMFSITTHQIPTHKSRLDLASTANHTEDVYTAYYNTPIDDEYHPRQPTLMQRNRSTPPPFTTILPF